MLIYFWIGPWPEKGFRPVVQVPGAEDDPALSAAIRVDGVEGLTHALVKRALRRTTV